MRRFFMLALLGVVLLTTGCGESAPISSGDMEDFLVDYYALDGALRHAQRSNKKLDRNAVYADFIKDHGYTVEQVDSAFAYWGARPKEYSEIYEKVVRRLEKKRDEVASQLE